MDTYIDKLRSLLIIDGLHTSRTDGTNHMYYVPHDKAEKIMMEADVEIKKLEKLIAEGMNVIPINKDVLKNPTALLNWRTKVITYFKHKEEVI